jgi:hypothetical protein
VKVLRKEVHVAFENGKVWDGSREDCPDNIFSTNEAFVSLDREESKVRGFRPFAGNFVVEFKGIYHKDNELPQPQLKAAKQIQWVKGGKPMSGTIPTHQEFSVVMEIVGSEWEGTKLFAYPWYMFERDIDGSAKQVGPGGEINKVNDLLKLAGFDFVTDNLAYSDNVLPELELLLQSKGPHQFTVDVVKGYVKDYRPLPVGLSMPKAKAKRNTKAPTGAKRGRPKKVADNLDTPREED